VIPCVLMVWVAGAPVSCTQELSGGAWLGVLDGIGLGGRELEGWAWMGCGVVWGRELWYGYVILLYAQSLGGLRPHSAAHTRVERGEVWLG